MVARRDDNERKGDGMKLGRGARALVSIMVATTALSACTDGGSRPRSASARPAGDGGSEKAAPVRYARDPYPSTYHAYPGVPTLVRNVTIFDGEGARIDNGQALIADGKIVAVGDLDNAPEVHHGNAVRHG